MYSHLVFETKEDEQLFFDEVKNLDEHYKCDKAEIEAGEMLFNTEEQENEYELCFVWCWRPIFLVSYIFYVLFAEIRHFVVKKQIAVFSLFLKFDWFHLFSMCVDIVAYDVPGKAYRFTVMYYLQSVLFNCRINLITQLGTLQSLESVFMIFRSANWSEREVWDMFGIFFSGHPDLRRILTDYGFLGFPLRKDFPLTGYKEIVYSDFARNTVYRRVEITQESRNYFYTTNWLAGGAGIN